MLLKRLIGLACALLIVFCVAAVALLLRGAFAYDSLQWIRKTDPEFSEFVEGSNGAGTIRLNYYEHQIAPPRVRCRWGRGKLLGSVVHRRAFRSDMGMAGTPHSLPPPCRPLTARFENGTGTSI